MSSELPDPSPYDLHLHTFWSYDARAEVEAHFRRASELGLRVIAITEHHHLDSMSDVLEVAGHYPGIRAIPAAELSVSTSIGAVDLLCYGLPVEPDARLTKLTDRYHEWQREAGAAVSAGMQALGFDYSDQRRLELLQTYRPQRSIDVQGVTHVNNNVQRSYFVERGYIHDDSGYKEILRRAAERVPVPPYPDVTGVVETVHAVGGLIAIAHPQGYFLENNVERMDLLRRECGLDGIECAHPAVDPALTPFYRDYCRRHGLFSVAGSDCHSQDQIETKFARHGGEAVWLDEFLERLDGPD